MNTNLLPWMREVKPGDFVRPKPLWNKTERPANHLAEPTEVLAVMECMSETGLVFRVRLVGGHVRELSSSWFDGPASPPAAVKG